MILILGTLYQHAVTLVDHVKAVQQFPRSLTRQGMQRFLAFVPFYRRFLPRAREKSYVFPLKIFVL
jgi:hypothetical protein